MAALSLFHSHAYLTTAGGQTYTRYSSRKARWWAGCGKAVAPAYTWRCSHPPHTPSCCAPGLSATPGWSPPKPAWTPPRPSDPPPAQETHAVGQLRPQRSLHLTGPRSVCNPGFVWTPQDPSEHPSTRQNLTMLICDLNSCSTDSSPLLTAAAPCMTF